MSDTPEAPPVEPEVLSTPEVPPVEPDGPPEPPTIETADPPVEPETDEPEPVIEAVPSDILVSADPLVIVTAAERAEREQAIADQNKPRR